MCRGNRCELLYWHVSYTFAYKDLSSSYQRKSFLERYFEVAMSFGLLLALFIMVECDAFSCVLVHPLWIIILHGCIVHPQAFAQEIYLLVNLSCRESDLE